MRGKAPGCQIFLGTKNWGKYTKLTQNVTCGHKIHHLAVKYTNGPKNKKKTITSPTDILLALKSLSVIFSLIMKSSKY
jgi:hypothetical protein